jgi:hypothetical protein
MNSAASVVEGGSEGEEVLATVGERAKTLSRRLWR